MFAYLKSEDIAVRKNLYEKKLLNLNWHTFVVFDSLTSVPKKTLPRSRSITMNSSAGTCGLSDNTAWLYSNHDNITNFEHFITLRIKRLSLTGKEVNKFTKVIVAYSLNYFTLGEIK